MSYDVTVKIDLAKPMGKIGFGVPLILESNATNAVPYTEVSGLDELAKVGVTSEGAHDQLYKAAQLMFAQKNAPKTIAVCAVATDASEALADESLVSKGWRHLIVVPETTYVECANIAYAIEALDGKMFFAGVHNKIDDEDLNLGEYRHTVLFHAATDTMCPYPVAALVGATAGRAAGSFTYKNLTLVGVTPSALTTAELKAIHDKGGIAFVTKAGDNVTSEGKVAGGEYIDVIDSEDYIIQQITYKTQKLLNGVDKVPYDNNGIALLESVVVDVLQSAYNNGMIATKEDGTPDYSVSFALREETSETDRANRQYFGGSFSFALAGAIHEVQINGTITY